MFNVPELDRDAYRTMVVDMDTDWLHFLISSARRALKTKVTRQQVSDLQFEVKCLTDEVERRKENADA